LIPFGRPNSFSALPRLRPLSFKFGSCSGGHMTPRKTKNFRMAAQPAEPLRVVHPDAAAIDVHSEVHWVCVPADRDPQPAQKFGSFTIDLEAIADFLARCRITTVVMESTGVYWIPLYELLEHRGFRVLLIDPRKARRLEGRPKM